MHRALALLVVSLTLGAGCFGKASDGKVPASDIGPERAAATAAETSDRPDDQAGAAPGVPTSVTDVPILLDGSLGSGAGLCVFAPVGRCSFVPVKEGNAGVILDGLTGWIDGGEVVLTWEAESPATKELSAGFMLMAGAEGCEATDLAGAQGASPLTLTVSPSSRPLCGGEVVHLWVAGTTHDFQDPVYYQVDVEQGFHAEGSFLLREAARDGEE